MEFVSIAEIGDTEWNRFCVVSDDAWFSHTTYWRDYTLALNPGKFQGQCRSFGVEENGQIVAICPLIMETVNRNETVVTELSYTGLPCPMPAMINEISKDKRWAILETLFNRIDELAHDNNVSRSTIWDREGRNPFNFTIRYGYLENNIASQAIDLRLDTDVLLKDMRKGHRADVKRIFKILNFCVFDRDNISIEIFNLYRETHEKAARRVTRDSKTFEMMFEWIKCGNAILCGAELEGSYIGFALIFLYKDSSYYASACNDPDFRHLPIGHGIQWAAINGLKDRGVNRYDVGLQVWSSQLHFPATAKEVAISRFKRGFGGRTFPIYVGEKYYDRDFFKSVYESRIHNYTQHLV